MIDIRKYSVGTRLGFGLGVIMIATLFVVAVAVINMQFNIKSFDNIIIHNNKKIQHANSINNAIHIMNDALHNIIHSSEQNQIDLENIRLLTAQAIYDHALNELEKMNKTENIEKIIFSLKRSFVDIKVQIGNIIKLCLNKMNHKAQILYMNEYAPSFKHIQQLCQELITYQNEITNLEYTQTLRKYKITFVLFIGIILSIILFTIFTAITLTKSITKPLEKAVEISNRLADGNYDVAINIKGNDEPGRLLKAMKELAARLKKAKEMEQQLYESQKMETLGRLAGGIAHDFNNMLSVILGNTQLIKMGASPFDEKLHKRLNSIEDAVLRASGFVKQLLAFSKKQPLLLERWDINKIINDFYKLLNKIVGEDIEIKLNLTEALPKVNVDVSQINQVILNLIVNAREAMPNGGTITIETYLKLTENGVFSSLGNSNKFVVISVKDTGVGIDKNIQNKIFEPFFTTKQNGTGLGLSVVYGIVKQHGGIIEFDSDQGKGTVFRIYLPAIIENEKTEKKYSNYNHQKHLPLGKETILIVEDNEEVRNLAKEMVKSLGYNVLTADDGLKGIEVFFQNKEIIDLIILDCVMPKKNGSEVFSEVRFYNSQIPVIFITGYNSNKIAEVLEGDKKTKIIQKPFSIEHLSYKIRELLDNRHSIGEKILLTSSNL